MLEASVFIGDLLDGLILDILEVVADSSLPVDLQTEGYRRNHRAFDLLGAPDGGVASVRRNVRPRTADHRRNGGVGCRPAAEGHVNLQKRVGLRLVALVRQSRELRAVGTLKLIAPVRLGSVAVRAAEVLDEVLELGGALDSDAVEGLVDLVDDEGHAPAVVQGVVHRQNELHLACLLLGDECVPNQGSAKVHALLAILHEVTLEVVPNVPGDILLGHDLSEAAAGNLDDPGAKDGAVCGRDVESVAKLVRRRRVGEVNNSLRDVRLLDLGRKGHQAFLKRRAGVNVLDCRLVDAAKLRRLRAGLLGGPSLLEQGKGDNGGLVLLGHLGCVLGHVLERGEVEDARHGQGNARLSGGSDELHRAKGVTAESEEAVVQTDAGLAAEDFGPHLLQRLFHLRLWLVLLGGSHAQAGNLLTGHGASELAQTLTVNLAGDQGRHFAEGDVGGGDHVAGDLGAQRNGGLAAAGLDNLGHDLDAGGHLAPEVVLDLGQLDSLTAELDLLVLAADEGDGSGAVGVVADQVASLVETAVSATGGSAAREEPGGVLDEDLVCLGLVVEVSQTDDRSLNEKLSNGAHGHQTLVVIRVDNPGNNHARRLAPRRSITRRDGLAAKTEDLKGRDDVRVQDTGDGGGHVRHVALRVADSTAQVVHAVLVRGNAETTTRGEAGVGAVADGPATGDGTAGEVFVGNHYALGLARATGRKLDVEGGGWRDVGQLRGELEGILVEGLIGGDDEGSLGSDAPAELALLLGSYDDSGTSLLDDGAQTGLGLAGVGEREGGAGLHDGQKSHGGPSRLLEAHGHSRADLDSPVYKMAREASREPLHVAVGKVPVPGFNGRPVGAVVGHLGDDILHASLHVLRELGVPCPQLLEVLGCGSDRV
ncbi:hypothetical protein ColTof4_09416 [Colletotrichum tofieldiae]|nr:hypothetical protein ColTof4_09416 [Colletotrichum tofieldiae]